MDIGKDAYHCSLCGKSQNEVRRLIVAPNNIYICNECVEQCNLILSLEQQPGLPLHEKLQQGAMHFPQKYAASGQNGLGSQVQFQQLADQVIKSLGVTGEDATEIQQITKRASRRLALMERPPLPNSMQPRRAYLAASYTEMLRLAGEVRDQMLSSVVSTGHLFLGMLRLDQKSIIMQLLNTLQVDRDQLQKEIEVHLRTATPETQSSLMQTTGFTTASDEAMELAYEEAYYLQHDAIGVEHFLLGMLRLENDPIAKIFHRHGLTNIKVREALARCS